jgi:hypothetical protein
VDANSVRWGALYAPRALPGPPGGYVAISPTEQPKLPKWQLSSAHTHWGGYLGTGWRLAVLYAICYMCIYVLALAPTRTHRDTRTPHGHPQVAPPVDASQLKEQKRAHAACAPPPRATFSNKKLTKETDLFLDRSLIPHPILGLLNACG